VKVITVKVEVDDFVPLVDESTDMPAFEAYVRARLAQMIGQREELRRQRKEEPTREESI
jgi:hypothetical protein